MVVGFVDCGRMIVPYTESGFHLFQPEGSIYQSFCLQDRCIGFQHSAQWHLLSQMISLKCFLWTSWHEIYKCRMLTTKLVTSYYWIMLLCFWYLWNCLKKDTYGTRNRRALWLLTNQVTNSKSVFVDKAKIIFRNLKLKVKTVNYQSNLVSSTETTGKQSSHSKAKQKRFSV